MANANSQTSVIDRILKIILICLILFLLFKYVENSEHEFASESGTAEEARQYSLDRVNQHILMTQDQIEFETLKAKDSLLSSAPELRKTKPQTSYQSPNTLNMDYEKTSDVLSEDLGRNPKDESFYAESPAELIRNDIYQQQKRHETEIEFIERKKQQIISNARAKGYDIELDERGERIIKWRKIKPSQDKYRSPSGSSAR